MESTVVDQLVGHLNFALERVIRHTQGSAKRKGERRSDVNSIGLYLECIV